MGFQVGDRVRVVAGGIDGNDYLSYGDEGVVRCIDSDLFSRPIGIEFDREIGGHDLYADDCRCEDGHGWYVYEKEIELVPPNDNDIPMQAPTAEDLFTLLSGNNASS